MWIKLAARSAFIASLFGLSLIATSPASAGEVGLLTCRSPQTTGYILWSSQAYNCVFQSSVGGGTQYYSATINRAGAEAGFSNNVILVWAVFAVSPQVGQGTLAGAYGGVSAGAAIGLGARANALFGGFPNSFALQPISVEGETGLNVRATVTGLWLQSAVRRPYRSHRPHRR
jgi:Protein of unknown function (DUF992)